MSQENVDRLRVAYERFGTDGLTMDLLTDDVEFRQPDEIGGGEGVYRGRDGVVRGVQQLLDVFDELRAEPEEFFVAGDYVVVFVRLRGRGKGSGVPIDVPQAHVWRFRADRWTFGTRTSTATRPSKPCGWRSRRCLTSPRPPLWSRSSRASSRLLTVAIGAR
jgi:ketosteroid isomerase-like protein